MNGPIVCGIDWSRRSWAALRLADALAARCDSRLKVVHVAPVATESVQRKRGERLHDGIRGVLGRHDVPVTIDAGDPVERLVAASRQAALLVIGSPRTGSLTQLLRGSLSARVIRRSPCPVVVVPPRATGTFDGTSLLCAVRDMRDLAAAATAACWARDLRAELVLASVIGPPRLPLAAGVAAVPPPPAMTAQETISAAWLELARVAAAVEAVTPCSVLAGSTAHSPGRVLRRLAAEEDAALVVVGPSRRSVLLAAATGSLTRSLLRCGTCPVMVCPRADQALAIRGAARPRDLSTPNGALGDRPRR